MASFNSSQQISVDNVSGKKTRKPMCVLSFIARTVSPYVNWVSWKYENNLVDGQDMVRVTTIASLRFHFRSPLCSDLEDISLYRKRRFY